MDIFYTPSMLLGPIRILLFILFIYAINIAIIRRRSKRRGVDYFMIRFSLFIGVLIIASMFLIQINSYDLFVILVFFMLIVLFTFLNINVKQSLISQLKKIQRRFIIYTIRTFENGGRFLSKKNFKKRETARFDLNINNPERDLTKNQLNWQVIIAISLGVLAFGSRYYFFYFDTYLLSDIWYNDLANLKDIAKSHWFFHQGTMMGQFSVINFYSEITGITDAVALTSFGLIESTLLTISLFWSVNKFTKTKIIPGLIAALSFIFFYAFLPLNINLITQPKSIFFGFIMVLPIIVYSFNPESLSLNTKKYFTLLFIFILGITFINLFLAVIILPIVLFIAIIFNYRRYKNIMIRLLAAYGLAVGCCFSILLIAAFVQQKDLSIFLNSNFYSYDSYTYSPQLILPINKLLDIYLYSAFTIFLLALFLWFANRRHKVPLMVALFICFSFTLPKLNFYLIDIDLLNQVLAICTPILFSLSAYIAYTLFSLFIKRSVVSIPLKVVTSCIVIVAIWYGVGNNALTKYPKKNPINEEIIKVYDKMNNDLLPFSYAVVNNYMNARLGENRHYFLNYSYFAKEYLKRDEIFMRHKNDKAYFKKNPSHVLPKSTFVFIYNEKAVLNTKNGLLLEEQKASLKSINLLKAKGRTVEIYYETPMLVVYEIINNPGSSKITDLLL